LQDNANKAKQGDVTAWLGMSDVYGQVGQSPVFQEAFSKAMDSIYVDGVEAAMSKYTQDTKK